LGIADFSVSRDYYDDQLNDDDPGDDEIKSICVFGIVS